MAIQSDETLVTKGDLKELYQDKILPYLGGNMMMTTNVSDYYSEDEKVVGIWTNGKPLYQKTFVFSGLTNGKIIQLNIPNFEYLVSIQGTVHTGDNRVFDNGAVDVASGGFVRPQVYDGKIVLSISGFGSDWASGGGTYTLQYTKTTDTADSALTTPGCYDLNRPDLWPTNKEIFFGNGLYGKRFMGTFTTANVWTDYLVQLDTIDRGKTLKIINRGGGIGRRNGDTYMPLGEQDTLVYDVWYASSLSGQTAGFRIRGKDNGTHSCSYDIWVTYTK